MFTTLIVQPIFNLLVLIYALLPGHNFGQAIIVFTILVRLLMWPLIKKQLHHAKAMRDLQPELKRIQKEAKGDRQKAAMLQMQLYKERQINPFASLGHLIVQIPIFLGLYAGLSRLVNNPQALVDFTYGFIRELGNMKEVAADITRFDSSLYGLVDLTRPALKNGVLYGPAFVILVASSIAQYFQSKQLIPTSKDGRKLRQILRDAGRGKAADQSEVSGAVNRGMIVVLPFFMLILFLGVPSGLALYFLVSSIVAIIQQNRILGEDKAELAAIADQPTKKGVIEGEVVAKPDPGRRRQGSKVKKGDV